MNNNSRRLRKITWISVMTVAVTVCVFLTCFIQYQLQTGEDVRNEMPNREAYLLLHHLIPLKENVDDEPKVDPEETEGLSEDMNDEGGDDWTEKVRLDGYMEYEALEEYLREASLFHMVLQEQMQDSQSIIGQGLQKLREKYGQHKVLNRQDWYAFYDILGNCVDEQFGTEEGIHVKELVLLKQLDSKHFISSDGRLQMVDEQCEAPLFEPIKVMIEQDRILSYRQPMESGMKVSNVWLSDKSEESISVYYFGEMFQIPVAYQVLDERNLLTEEHMMLTKIADIEISQGQITEIYDKELLPRDKVVSVSEQEICLENQGSFPMSERMKIYETFGGISEGERTDIVIGYDYTDFVFDEGNITAALVTQNEGMDKIRVLIKGNEYASLLHETVNMISGAAYRMEKYDTESGDMIADEHLEAGTCVQVVRSMDTSQERDEAEGQLDEEKGQNENKGQQDEEEEQQTKEEEKQDEEKEQQTKEEEQQDEEKEQQKKEEGQQDKEKEQQEKEELMREVILHPGEEIVITPDHNEGRIQIQDLGRSQGVPEYRGTMICRAAEEGIAVVNELLLEEYLYAVVPSEMPSSYPIEALKAQAVCARTYAYGKMQNALYPVYGAHIDDSTTCQVYQNIAEQPMTNQAVDATFGEVLCDQAHRPVNVYYYATSCGFGTTEEIWGNGKAYPYIQAKPIESNREEQKEASTETERFTVDSMQENEVIKEYLSTTDNRDLEWKEPWYRWKVITKKVDITALSERLQRLYKNHPDKMLTWNEVSQQYEQKEIPGIVSLENVQIVKRLPGGVADQMLLSANHRHFLICGEQNIRMVLSQAGEVIERQDGSKVDTTALLPSGFMDVAYEGGSIMITGGGYGHGVGMSQNAAAAMARNRMTEEEILYFFFHDVVVEHLYQK